MNPESLQHLRHTLAHLLAASVLELFPGTKPTIGPAIRQARSEGILADGPFPADTVFLAARNGRFDAVVTMYHDQGQIATKLLGFERGVTIHGGLPLPITTPAHGTAFDIAGKGIASVGAIKAAFAVAVRSLNSNQSR